MDLTAVEATGIALRLGAVADFQSVRSALLDCGFTETGVTTRLGLPVISRFQSIADGRTVATELNDGLDLLIRLFMDQEGMTPDQLKRFLSTSAIDAITRLGLIYQHDGLVYCQVLLYPAEGFLVVSDCTISRPGRSLGGDVVYPAITDHTSHFLRMLPRTRCGTFLEGCGGTGIAALAATRFAGHSTTIDITLRAAWFAEFTRRLNDVTNLTSLQGDMYAPVAGQRFDRIVAHPPFVAAQETRVIYRDGGQDGEELVRRAVLEGISLLADDGLLYVACVASDRKSGRLEQRMRELLGSTGSDIDLLLLTRFELDPFEYRIQMLRRHRLPLGDLEGPQAHFDRFGIERVVASHLYFRKRRGSGPAFTHRRPLMNATVDGALWLLDVEAALADRAALPQLLDRVARPAPDASMLLRYLQQSEGWLPAEASLETVWPFPAVVRAPVWLADMVNQLDGTTRPAEVLGRLRSTGQIPAEVSDSALADLVLRLISTGILTVDGVPAPPPLPQS